MESSCVRQTLIPATSKLFGDYLYDFDRVADFFPYYFGDSEAFVSASKQIDFPDSRRAALVSALREQNGDSDALQKLAQPGTVAVVTGQQVGLFSGPAYTVLKAVTAAKLAQKLSDSGVAAVAVFWLATEDHDLAEVDHAWVFDRHVTPRKISLPQTANGGPVGEVAFESWPLDDLRSALGDLPFAEDVIAKVADAYRPGATLGSAFRAFLKDILSELDLLYVDPLAPSIRDITAPFLSRAVEEIPSLIPLVRQRDAELVARGYHAQVHIEENSSLLFLVNGKRNAVRWKDGQFVAKDRTYTTAELAQLGHSLSPNALLRPVMQDYLLPTVAYVGGPAEVAYMAQAQVLYEKLLGRMPVIFPRNSMTLLDERATKILDKYGLKVTDLLDTRLQATSRIACKLVPAGLAEEFGAVRGTLAESIEKLQSDLTGFDPTLEAAAKKSGAKILYQIDKLARKTANETMRRNKRAADDASYVLNLVYPERHLQERFYSIVPFLAKYGLDLPKQLMEQTQLACPDHIVRTI
ncbi:MAG: bacillithiol biosynthesis cysteine-adding enzyme BshC [Acidobacteriota bacterium]|nr:bacillithiol biosynthesis cysteine-adding enzyme BshC [Acidobacteriota bacterium]